MLTPNEHPLYTFPYTSPYIYLPPFPHPVYTLYIPPPVYLPLYTSLLIPPRHTPATKNIN